MPGSRLEAAAVAASPGAWLAPDTWRELLVLSQDELGERAVVERLLAFWRDANGASCAALYVEREGRHQLELVTPLIPLTPASHAAAPASPPPLTSAGDQRRALPKVLDPAAADPADVLLHLPGGLLYAPQHALDGAGAAAGAAAAGADDGATPLPLAVAALLGSALKVMRLRQELKDQQFQVNYRVVELESLYDVGLAVAATLDLEKLSEEILLRAVSLLDARRGALYIVENGRYRLQRTFGGDAAPWFDSANTELLLFLAGSGAAPAELLPGARYLMGVPIDIEGSPRGLLAVGDKESRRGVGPFPSSDLRTLGLFANQAAIALENARLHLQALEQERLEREMHLAADIQRRILPREAPQVAGYELLGWNRPARQIGGDYYDLFVRQNGRVGLVVGDVSGKGMPAALMVSTLHSALHLLLDQAGFGPELFERLNRHVLESSASNKFITLLLADLDPASGSLTYLNAGHNPALLLHRHPAAGPGAGQGDGAGAGAGAGAAESGGHEQLGSTGLPIGVLPGSRFTTRAVDLQPGDLLCIYSDGITEAESAAEEEFGTARLLAVLQEHSDRPLQHILDAIQAATAAFSAGLPQGDDQTVVLLRRNPA